MNVTIDIIKDCKKINILAHDGKQAYQKLVCLLLDKLNNRYNTIIDFDSVKYTIHAKQDFKLNNYNYSYVYNFDDVDENFFY